jgi:hypothetical protein
METQAFNFAASLHIRHSGFGARRQILSLG